MGLYSRDYYRELTPSPWSFERAPVVKYLIIVNIVIFLLQILVVRPPRMSELEAESQLIDNKDRPLTKRQIHELMRALHSRNRSSRSGLNSTPKVVEGGHVWRLLTHTFCHDRHAISTSCST